MSPLFSGNVLILGILDELLQLFEKPILVSLNKRVGGLGHAPLYRPISEQVTVPGFPMI